MQGREKGYFAFVQPDGTFEESFETVLARRERECNEVLELARSPLYRWPLGSEEKLAFYAALLFRRATQQRTYSEGNWNKIIEGMRQASCDAEYMNAEVVAVMEQLLERGHAVGLATNFCSA